MRKLGNYGLDQTAPSSHHNFNTRNKDNFHLPMVSTNWGKQRFVYHVIKEFNYLEASIREVKSSHLIKTKTTITLTKTTITLYW